MGSKGIGNVEGIRIRFLSGGYKGKRDASGERRAVMGDCGGSICRTIKVGIE